MIKAVMVMNTQGKTRLAKFYEYLPVEKQQELIRGVFAVLCSRAENVSNFIDAESIFGPDSCLVYKHFATLYFVFVFDSSENELAVLDLIQVFVETLDRCFKNVCELDIVFNYSKVHTILDEMIFGGQVVETSSSEIIKAVEEISKLEAASNAITLIPKSASGWRSQNKASRGAHPPGCTEVPHLGALRAPEEPHPGAHEPTKAKWEALSILRPRMIQGRI